MSGAGGEHWILLATVAECYEVDEGWVLDAYELGLLGPGRALEQGLAIRSTMLERVAVVRRLALQQDLDLSGVAALLALLED